MGQRALLEWHPPFEIDVTVHGQLSLKGDLRDIPNFRGMYLFARKTRAGIIPIYVGLASRSIRQRLKQHLKSERMIEELVDGRRSKRLFFYAELVPGDLEYSKRYLPSFERALIGFARDKRGAKLNRRLRPLRGLTERCEFRNSGYRPAWVDWAPTRVKADLLRPRGAG